MNNLSQAHSNLEDWRQVPMHNAFHQKMKPTYVQESHINTKKVTWQQGTCQELRYEFGEFFSLLGTIVFVIRQLGIH